MAVVDKVEAFLRREHWITTWAAFWLDLFNGLAVSMAMLPESIAFSIIAGVNPLIGIRTSFIIGLITSVFGGQPGMISGTTGALAVIQALIVESDGEQYLYAATILLGPILIVVALLRVSAFMQLVSFPVFVGFVNGLAVVIGLSQLPNFEDDDGSYVSGSKLALTLMHCAIAFAIVMLFPFVTKRFPATLVAILSALFIEHVFELGTRQVGDITPVSGDLPSFGLPDVEYTWDTFVLILPHSLRYAAVIFVEGIMTANIVGMIVKRRSNDMRELTAQGVANIVAGFLGSMGGDPLVGQSLINVLGGSSGRLSGFVSSLLLLASMLFAHPVVERIPLGGLAGIMFGVVVHTWHLRTADLFVNRRVPTTDLVIIAVVTLVTIFVDVAIGIFCGVVLSALIYAWHSTRELKASVQVSKSSLTGGPVAHISILGPMFFGSGRALHQRIVDLELEQHTELEHVIIDLTHAAVHDVTALTALNEVAIQFLRTQQFLHVRSIRAAAEKLVSRGHTLMPDIMDDSPAGVGLWRVDIAQRHCVCAVSGHAILPGDLRMGCTAYDADEKINVYLWIHVDDPETRRKLRHARAHPTSLFACCPGTAEDIDSLSYDRSARRRTPTRSRPLRPTIRRATRPPPSASAPPSATLPSTPLLPPWARGLTRSRTPPSLTASSLCPRPSVSASLASSRAPAPTAATRTPSGSALPRALLLSAAAARHRARPSRSWLRTSPRPARPRCPLSPHPRRPATRSPHATRPPRTLLRRHREPTLPW
ncbi:sulfate transporter, partial [Thecamonas trahens ATCC 50062]